MNKRGQIYLLVAIIFSFVIYLLASNLNTVKKTPTDDNFIDISNNYDKESAKFLTALSQEQLKNPGYLVADSFNVFAAKFTSYSGTVNPDFGFIYFFDYGDKENRQLIVGNHLEQDILVWLDNADVKNILDIQGCKSLIPLGVGFGNLASGITGLLENCLKTIPILTTDNTYNVNFVVGNIKYTTNVIKGVPEIVILSEERNEVNRKVYTNHKFEKGENWVSELNGYCNTIGKNILPIPLICDCSNVNRNNENNCLINDLCRWDASEGKCKNV